MNRDVFHQHPRPRPSLPTPTIVDVPRPLLSTAGSAFVYCLDCAHSGGWIRYELKLMAILYTHINLVHQSPLPRRDSSKDVDRKIAHVAPISITCQSPNYQ